MEIPASADLINTEIAMELLDFFCLLLVGAMMMGSGRATDGEEGGVDEQRGRVRFFLSLSAV